MYEQGLASLSLHQVVLHKVHILAVWVNKMMEKEGDAGQGIRV